MLCGFFKTYLDDIDYLQEHTCSVYILNEDVHICIFGNAGA